jgi:hypothetical protein
VLCSVISRLTRCAWPHFTCCSNIYDEPMLLRLLAALPDRCTSSTARRRCAGGAHGPLYFGDARRGVAVPPTFSRPARGPQHFLVPWTDDKLLHSSFKKRSSSRDSCKLHESLHAARFAPPSPRSSDLCGRRKRTSACDRADALALSQIELFSIFRSDT